MIRVRIAELAQRRQRPRPLGSYVAWALVPRTALFLTLGAALLVGNAIAVNPLAAPADTTKAPMPTWTSVEAEAYPRCVPASAWPEGRLADAVVGFNFRAARSERIAFDTAWERNHNKTEVDDVWVVGVCP